MRTASASNRESPAGGILSISNGFIWNIYLLSLEEYDRIEQLNWNQQNEVENDMFGIVGDIDFMEEKKICIDRKCNIGT